MPYIGNQTSNAFTSMDKQSITGDGGPNYTLDHAVANAQEIEVFVNNVRQEPGVAYTVSGTTLTMTGNVASNDDFYVVYQGLALQTVVPPDGTVTAAKLETNIKIPGHTIQVVRLTSWNQVENTNSSSFANNQSVTITPKYNDSLIYVAFNLHARLRGTSGAEMRGGWRILRASDSTVIFNSSGTLETMHYQGSNNEFDIPIMISAFDNPASTSSITYRLQGKIHSSGTSGIRTFASDFGGAIYAMEIAQ